MDWARVLAYVTGTVDQELLARNECLAAENRILKTQLKGRLKLSDAERATLGEIGHRLGRKALAEVATVARPDTILAWHRKLVASKFDGSKARRGSGRPRIRRKVEQLIVRLTEENRHWGFDRIAGALANLGHKVCDQTIGNVLQRHDLPPAPQRKRTTTWSFRAIIASGQVEPLALPARCPNLNAYAERWVRSVKEECLSKVILLGERSLRRAMNEFVEHYHAKRNHQGKGNVLLFPRDENIGREPQPVQCRERLGGLLRYYHQEAA